MAAILGFAVGAVVTMVVIVDALVLNPVPVPHPEQLVALGGLAYGRGLDDPVAYWSEADGLESLALYRAGDITIAEGSAARWTRTAEVSGPFFRVFLMSPAIGRALRREDETESSDVAVVSDAFWRARLGAREDVLGQQIRVGDRVYAVVGVAQRGFDFPPGTKVWIPRARVESRRPALVEGASELAVIRRPGGWVGRVRSDSTFQQVKSQLEALLRHANEVLSRKTEIRYGEIVGVTPLVESMRPEFRPALYTLLAGAVIVLIVATTNAALFALGLSVRRRLELAVRQVLGASAWRIGWHLVADALAVGCVSSVLGLLSALLLLRIAGRSLHAFGVELSERSALLVMAFGLSLALGILSGLLGGILPAIRARRQDLIALLNRSAASGSGQQERVLRRGFTVVQVASAVVLGVGAILTVRTSMSLGALDLGQSWQDVGVVRLWMAREDLGGRDLARIQRDLLDQAGSVPGITTAAFADRSVLESRDRGFAQVRSEDASAMASTVEVAGDYFGAMQIPIVEGVPPATGDAFAVVVNETLARALWPQTNPIGRSLQLDGRPAVFQVVGVCRDTLTVDQGTQQVPELFLTSSTRAPAPPGPAVRFNLLIRCPRSCRSALEAVHQRLSRQPGVTVYAASVGGDLLDRVNAPGRIRAILWTVCALLTLGIALLGVGALVSYAVTLRKFEIGVRLAVGSTRAQTIWLVSWDGAVCGVVGVVVGAMVAVWLSQFAGGFLPGIETADWPLVTIVGAAVLSAAGLASVVPALRISGNEPLDLLRGG